MGFYEDTRTAALAAKTAKEDQRRARATVKEMRDSIEAAITTVRAEGELKCLLLGAEALANTTSARVAPSRIADLMAIEVPPELVEPIANRLQKNLGFYVSQFSAGIKKIDWEPAEKFVEPAAPVS